MIESEVHTYVGHKLLFSVQDPSHALIIGIPETIIRITYRDYVNRTIFTYDAYKFIETYNIIQKIQ